MKNGHHKILLHGTYGTYLTVTQPSYVVDANRGQICAIVTLSDSVAVAW